MLARKWMEVKAILLSDIRQTEKDKYHVISNMQNLELKNKSSEMSVK
jgi:hypothetical protein